MNTQEFFNRPAVKGSNPNPFVYGKPWRIGDDLTDAERGQWSAEWQAFEQANPHITFPIRRVEE